MLVLFCKLYHEEERMLPFFQRNKTLILNASNHSVLIKDSFYFLLLYTCVTDTERERVF